jgi:segregation and condensation protein A
MSLSENPSAPSGAQSSGGGSGATRHEAGGTVPGADGSTVGGLEGGDAFAGEGTYAVKLPVFEGPLDLLLHLIRQNEVDITDIPIALIGEQYLAYIDLMKELDVDVAAEYLVMAATLALIKSRMLLPPEETEIEGEEMDPRAELVARLLEYKRFKEAAETLARRRLLGRDIFEASGPVLEGTPEAERELDVGLFELIEAFRRVLAEARDAERVHAVETETVTVRERMIYVMEVLEDVEAIEFSEIFRTRGSVPPSRPMLVATFLAVLELARLTALSIYQGANDEGAPEGPIRIRAQALDPDAPSWYERITETM